MFHLFEGNTADEVWLASARSLLNDSNAQTFVGRGGDTIEILHAAFSIQNPRQRWVISRNPPINPAFALAEVVWILSGRNDSTFLNKWNSKLPKYAGNGPIYHGAYGYRLRRQFKTDQIHRAYSALKHNPQSRQVVLLIWNPKLDLPDKMGNPREADIPCNTMSMIKIRNGKLEWTQIMRSNDLFMGTPYNFIQFTSLQEIMAGWLGVEAGSYNHLSDSLHIYLNTTDAGFSYLDTEAAVNTDSLALPKKKFDTALKILCNEIESLFTPDLSKDRLCQLAGDVNLPTPYRNIFLVMESEIARRNGWLDLSQVLIQKCTNPALVQAWQRWFQRLQ